MDTKWDQESMGIIEDLIAAGHILHNHGVLDAFGHVSVRDPHDSNRFIMSYATAPALVNVDSLVTYDVENAQARFLTLFPAKEYPSEQNHDFIERFIHSEIYKQYPDINSVVHAHTHEVLPFAIDDSEVLVPLMHTSGFLDNGAPVFYFTPVSKDDPEDMLVRNAKLGHKLASYFEECPVVLMRYHGMTVVAHSIRKAVSRAYYTRQNAIVQQNCRAMDPHLDDIALSPKAALDCAKINESDKIINRLWALWIREVDNQPGLYVNDARRRKISG